MASTISMTHAEKLVNEMFSTKVLINQRKSGWEDETNF